MANSILEVFNQDELDLIFEALEHRRRYYENKIPQQRTNVVCGTVKSALTLEKYIGQEERLRKILAKWVEDTI